MFTKIKENLLEIFFPAKCVCCERLGSFLCDDCRQEIAPLVTQTCPKCNAVREKGKYCSRCRPKVALGGIISFGYFKDPFLKELIHGYKYERLAALAPLLSGFIIETLKKENPSYDAVSFVPISRKRLGWRGYNQAELLAVQIAAAFNKPLVLGLVKKKDTKTQVGLPKKKRENNLKGTFEYDGESLTGKRILLVDDVTTTGTTLNECAKVLKQNGARSVWGAVLAKE